MSFTNIKNTGNVFPLCLSSAQQPGRESRDVGGDYQGISSLSLTLRIHLHWAGFWHVFEEPLKCPSSGVSKCSAKDSTWAMVERDTGWEPEHPLQAAAPTQPLAPSGWKPLPHRAVYSCLGCLGGRACWVSTGTVNVQFGKKNTAWNSCLYNIFQLT